jgi:hypothetical protein
MGAKLTGAKLNAALTNQPGLFVSGYDAETPLLREP